MTEQIIETVDHPDQSQDQKKINSITIWGMVINIILSAIKILAGSIVKSVALIADGIHSLSDLVTDVAVLVSSQAARRPADISHPYGHGKIETIGTQLIGLILLIVGVGIGYSAGHSLYHHEKSFPGPAVAIVALVSVIAKELLFQFTQKLAKQIHSSSLYANAWHHRSDAISSVIVLVGVGGSMLGWPYLDAVAAIGVAIMIGKIGWDISFQSVLELVDTGLEPEHVAIIEDRIQSIPGVKQLHMMRTRRVGGNALVDVHIQVSPKLSVSEGHYIGEKVRSILIEEDDEVSDVMVHIDPEDDEKIALSSDLPTRKEVESLLHQRWLNIPSAAFIEKIILHYLDGKIHVELLLPLDKLQHPEQAAEIAGELARTGDSRYIADIQVLFH